MASSPRQPDLTNGAESQRPTSIRHVIVFVSTLMAVLLYLDRFCVSFAVDYIREDLSLTQTQMSWFLSAFFWSYALAQVPSGWLSDRYGARIMLVIYILSWSFFTAMIGAATSFAMLLLMRLACGLGQAGAYPTSASLVSKWVPFSNRGTASSFIAFGGRCGGALAPLLTAYLIVFFVPLSTPVTLQPENILRGSQLCAKLSPLDDASHAPPAGITAPSSAGLRIWSLLPQQTQDVAAQVAADYRKQEAKSEQETQPGIDLTDGDHAILLSALNGLLDRDDIYRDDDFQTVKLSREALSILKRLQAKQTVSSTELGRFNRFLLEGTFREEIGKLYVQGWRPVMYVYGFAGLFVAAIFWIYFRNRPEEHPRSNRAEHELIASGRPPGAPSPHGKPGMVPLKQLVTSRSMWFVCVAQVGTNIGWVFLVTWLPRYLIEVHNVPILQRGMMATVPLLVGIVGMLAGGRFTDYLAGRVGLLWGRRFPMMITRFSAAFAYVLCLWFGSFSPDSIFNSPWAFTMAFALVAFSTDMGSPATWAFKQDVGGRYVGSILGWGNMWGNLGAAVSPPIYNYFLGESPTLENWNQMFVVCMVSFLFAGVCAFGVDATVPIAPPDEADDDDSQDPVSS